LQLGVEGQLTGGAARLAHPWCNARRGPRGLGSGTGIEAEGETFALPDIGPGVLMSKAL
jgi:hypothetical protein